MQPATDDKDSDYIVTDVEQHDEEMLLNDEEGPSLPDTDNVAAVARDTPKYAHTSKPHVSALDRHVYNLTTSYNPDPIIHSTDFLRPVRHLQYDSTNDEDAFLHFEKSFIAAPLPPVKDVNPTTYSKAMNWPDENHWLEAVKHE